MSSSAVSSGASPLFLSEMGQPRSDIRCDRALGGRCTMKHSGSRGSRCAAVLSSIALQANLVGTFAAVVIRPRCLRYNSRLFHVEHGLRSDSSEPFALHRMPRSSRPFVGCNHSLTGPGARAVPPDYIAADISNSLQPKFAGQQWCST